MELPNGLLYLPGLKVGTLILVIFLGALSPCFGGEACCVGDGRQCCSILFCKYTLVDIVTSRRWRVYQSRCEITR